MVDVTLGRRRAKNGVCRVPRLVSPASASASALLAPLLLLLPSLGGCGGVQRAVLGPPVVEVEAVAAPGAAAPSRAAPPPPPPPRSGGARFVTRPDGSRIDVLSGDLLGTYPSRILRYRGGVEVERADAQRGRVWLDLDMTSLRAESRLVTAVLQLEFLEIDDYPRARLEGTVRPSGGAPDERVVEGFLDLHGVRRPITFKGMLRRQGDALRFTSSFELDRHAFGIRRHDAWDWTTRDDIRVTVDLRSTPEHVSIEEVPPPR